MLRFVSEIADVNQREVVQLAVTYEATWLDQLRLCVAPVWTFSYSSNCKCAHCAYHILKTCLKTLVLL